MTGLETRSLGALEYRRQLMTVGLSVIREYEDVGENHWETIHMKLDLRGKVMMMKSVDFSTTEDSSDFQMQPQELGYQEAIRLLQKIPADQLASR